MFNEAQTRGMAQDQRLVHSDKPFDRDKTRLALEPGAFIAGRVEREIRKAAFLHYCDVTVEVHGNFWNVTRTLLVELRGTFEHRHEAAQAILSLE